MKNLTILKVEVVKDPEPKFPFMCSICGFIMEKEDYLRFHFNESPTTICIHERCMLKSLIKIGIEIE